MKTITLLPLAAAFALLMPASVYAQQEPAPGVDDASSAAAVVAPLSGSSHAPPRALAAAASRAQQGSTAPAAAGPAPVRPVQHLPIHHAWSEQAELRFRVPDPDRAGAIIVRCRPWQAAAQEQEVEARRGPDNYRARMPLACAQPPGFSYFVIQRGPAGETTPVFASAEAAHPVRVTLPPDKEAELARLRAHGYARSRALLGAELVSFGERTTMPGAATVRDRYYRLEIGYAYSFFGTIEDIALSIVRVRGEQAGVALQPGSPEPLAPGIDYGRAAVTLLASEFVRLRSSLLLGASQRGFEWGGGGEIVFGDPRTEHMLFGVEGLTTLGVTGYLQLGFNATSSVPMGARVEVTNFPIGADTALRLLYQVGYRFTSTTELTLRGGYQGRAAVGGGPSLGATLRYGF